MHRILELVAIGSSPDSSRLARIDVRVKLIVAVAAILAAVLSTRVWLPLVSLAVCLAVLTASRAPLRITLYRFTAPLGITAAICLLRALTTGTTVLWSLPLGPWQLVLTREGLADGALIGARVLGSIGAIIVLCTFTQAHELFAALRWARLPRTWVEIAMLMMRAIFTLFEQAGNVLAAQKVRLGRAGFRRSLASLGSLAGIVLLRSLDQTERTHEAMVVRGYRGTLPLPKLPPLTGRQRAVCGLAVAAIVAAFVLAERWPL
jgi:cobalt/nickel transport system permease protein